MALLTALVRCQLCGSGIQPSPLATVDRMTKSQLELAKELLRIFKLQHVLTPSNASHRVELNYPNGTRAFVPSNPYWILMNETLKVSRGSDLHGTKPAGTTVRNVLTPKDSEEAFIMASEPAKQRASRIISRVKAATTSAKPVYVPSPGHRTIQIAELRPSTLMFKPPPMQRFTFEDAPKSRPLLYTLERESVAKKIVRANSMASLSVSVNRSTASVRSDEVDLDPSASSDLKFQPAMRIITSPANSVKHQLPATYNHAFVVLGQPAGKGKALSSELSRSDVSALGAAFGDLIQVSESSQQPRRGRRYEHVFNIGDKPVLRAAKLRTMDVRLQLNPVPTRSTHSGFEKASHSAELSQKGASYLGASTRPIPAFYDVSSASKLSIPHHDPEHVSQKWKVADSQWTKFETTEAGGGFQPTMHPVPRLVSSQRGPSRGTSVYAQSQFWNMEKLHGPSQWVPIKKSFVKRDAPANSTLQPNSKADVSGTTVSPLLDDSNTVKPGPRWRGIFKPGYYRKLNLTTLKMVSQDTFPNVIIATEIRRGPVSSMSPFDTAPIGSTKRVMTIYGKATSQKPVHPTRSALNSQDLSEVGRSGTAKRRSDESHPSKLSYTSSLSDKYSERELRRPDRKGDSYLLPTRDLRTGARRPAVESSAPVDTKSDPKFEAKFDPEFERSRFLTPPPLFPERLPPRSSSDEVYPRVRDGLSPHHFEKSFPDRGFSSSKDYTPERGFSPERGFPPDRGFSLQPDKNYPPSRGFPPERGLPPERDYSRDRYPPDRGYPPEKGYPRQEPGRRPRPHGESGRAPPNEDEDDPSRFDEFAAWKQLTRHPVPAGFPGSLMPMGFGYPPFRGTQFGGPSFGGPQFGGPQFGGPQFGGPQFGGQGIGTILPVKKPKLKLLFGKGTFRSPLSLFGSGQQGWYCPCNYYPQAGRFVTTGFPGFWGGMPGGD